MAAARRISRVLRRVGGKALRLAAGNRAASRGGGLRGGFTQARAAQAMQALGAAEAGKLAEWRSGRGAMLHPRGFHGRFQSTGGEKPRQWQGRAIGTLGQGAAARGIGGPGGGGGGGGGGGATSPGAALRRGAAAGGVSRSLGRAATPNGGTVSEAAQVEQTPEEAAIYGTRTGRAQLTQPIPMYRNLADYVPTTVRRAVIGPDGQPVVDPTTGQPAIDEHYSMPRAARRHVEGLLRTATRTLATDRKRKPREPSKGMSSRKAYIRRLDAVGSEQAQKNTPAQREAIEAVTTGRRIESSGPDNGHSRWAELQRSVADPNALLMQSTGGRPGPRGASHKQWYLESGVNPDDPDALQHMHRYSPDVEHLTKAMQPLSDSHLVQGYMTPDWIGIDPNDPAQWDRIDEMNGWRVSDPTFMFTRIGNPFSAEEMQTQNYKGPFIRYSLVVPKGTKAVVPGKGSDKIILDRETPWRVTRVTTEPDGSKTLWGVVDGQGAGHVEPPLGMGLGRVGHRGVTTGRGGKPGIVRAIRGEKYKPGRKELHRTRFPGTTRRLEPTEEQKKAGIRPMTPAERQEDTRIRQAMSGLGWRKVPGTGAGTGKPARYMTTGRGMGGRRALTDEEMLRPNWNPKTGRWDGKDAGSFIQHLMDSNDSHLAKMLRPGTKKKPAETFDDVTPEELVKRLQAWDARNRGVEHIRERSFRAASRAAVRRPPAERTEPLPENNKVVQAWHQARGDSASNSVFLEDLRNAPAMRDLSRAEQDAEIQKALDAGLFKGSPSGNVGLPGSEDIVKAAFKPGGKGKAIHILRPTTQEALAPGATRTRPGKPHLGPGHNLGPAGGGPGVRTVRVKGKRPEPLPAIKDKKKLATLQKQGLAKPETYVQYTDEQGRNRIGRILAVDEETGRARVQWGRMPRELFQGPSSRRPIRVKKQSGVDLSDAEWQNLQDEGKDPFKELRRFPYEVSPDGKTVQYEDANGRLHLGTILRRGKNNKATVEWRTYPEAEELVSANRSTGKILNARPVEDGVDLTKPEYTLGKHIQQYYDRDADKFIYRVGEHKVTKGGREIHGRKRVSRDLESRERNLTDKQRAARERERDAIKGLLGEEEQQKAIAKIDAEKRKNLFVGGHEGMKPSRGDIIFDTEPRARQTKPSTMEKLVGRHGGGGEKLSESRRGEVIEIGTRTSRRLGDGDIRVRWLDGSGEEVIPASKYNDVGRTSDGRPHLQYRFLTKDDWDSRRREAEKALQGETERKRLRGRGQSIISPERAMGRSAEKPEERERATQQALKDLDELAVSEDRDFDERLGKLLGADIKDLLRAETVEEIAPTGAKTGAKVRVKPDTMTGSQIRAQGARLIQQVKDVARVLRGKGTPGHPSTEPGARRAAIRRGLRVGARSLLSRGQEQVERKVEAAKRSTKSGGLRSQEQHAARVMAGGQGLQDFIEELRKADSDERELLLNFKATDYVDADGVTRHTTKLPSYQALARAMGIPTGRPKSDGTEGIKQKTTTMLKGNIIAVLEGRGDEVIGYKGAGIKPATKPTIKRPSVRPTPVKAVEEPEKTVSTPKPRVKTAVKTTVPPVQQEVKAPPSRVRRPEGMLAGKELDRRAAELKIRGRSTMKAQEKRDAIAAEEKRLGIKPGEAAPAEAEAPKPVKVTRPAVKAAPAKPAEKATPARAVKRAETPKTAAPKAAEPVTLTGTPAERRQKIVDIFQERGTGDYQLARELGFNQTHSAQITRLVKEGLLEKQEGSTPGRYRLTGRTVSEAAMTERPRRLGRKAAREAAAEREAQEHLASLRALREPTGESEQVLSKNLSPAEIRRRAKDAKLPDSAEDLRAYIRDPANNLEAPENLDRFPVDALRRHALGLPQREGGPQLLKRGAVRVPEKAVPAVPTRVASPTAAERKAQAAEQAAAAAAGRKERMGGWSSGSKSLDDVLDRTKIEVPEGKLRRVMENAGAALERGDDPEKVASRVEKAPRLNERERELARRLAESVRNVRRLSGRGEAGPRVVREKPVKRAVTRAATPEAAAPEAEQKLVDGPLHQAARDMGIAPSGKNPATGQRWKADELREAVARGRRPAAPEAKPAAAEAKPKVGRTTAARVNATYAKYGLDKDDAARADVEKLDSKQRISYYAARRALDKPGKPAHEAAMARVAERYGLEGAKPEPTPVKGEARIARGDEALSAPKIKTITRDIEPGNPHSDFETKITNPPKGWSKSKIARAERALHGYNIESGDSSPWASRENPLSEDVQAIDEIMGHSEIGRPVEVWRGMRSGKGVFGEDAIKGSLVGKTVTADGFMSTSASKDIAQDTYALALGGRKTGMLMRMHVPAGVHGIRFGGYEDDDPNQEILLERGLRLTVTGDKTVNGIRHLDVTVSRAPEDEIKQIRAAEPQVAEQLTRDAADGLVPAARRVVSRPSMKPGQRLAAARSKATRTTKTGVRYPVGGVEANRAEAVLDRQARGFRSVSKPAERISARRLAAERARGFEDNPAELRKRAAELQAAAETSEGAHTPKADSRALVRRMAANRLERLALRSERRQPVAAAAPEARSAAESRGVAHAAPKLASDEKQAAELRILQLLEREAVDTEKIRAAGGTREVTNSLTQQGFIRRANTPDGTSGMGITVRGLDELTHRLRLEAAGRRGEREAPATRRIEADLSRLTPTQRDFIEKIDLDNDSINSVAGLAHESELSPEDMGAIAKQFGFKFLRNRDDSATRAMFARSLGEKLGLPMLRDRTRRVTRPVRAVPVTAARRVGTMEAERAARHVTPEAERGTKEPVKVTRAADVPTRRADKEWFGGLSEAEQKRVVERVRALRKEQDPARPGKTRTTASVWAQVVREEKAGTAGEKSPAQRIVEAVRTETHTGSQLRLVKTDDGEAAISGTVRGSSLQKMSGSIQDGSKVPLRRLLVDTDIPGEEVHVPHGTLYKRNGVLYIVEHKPGTVHQAISDRWVDEAAARHVQLPEEGKRLLHAQVVRQGSSQAERDLHRLTGNTEQKTYAETYYDSLRPGEGGYTVFSHGGRSIAAGEGPAEADHIYFHETWHLIGAAKNLYGWKKNRDGELQSVPSRRVAGVFESNGPDSERWRDYDFVPLEGSRRSQSIGMTLESGGLQHLDRPVPEASTGYGASSWGEAVAEDGGFYNRGVIGRWVPKHGTSGLQAMDAYYRDIYPERAQLFDEITPDIAERQAKQLAERARSVKVPAPVRRNPTVVPERQPGPATQIVREAAGTEAIRGLGPVRRAALDKALATGVREGTSDELGLTPGEASQLARTDVGVLRRTGIKDGKSVFALNEEHQAVRAATPEAPVAPAKKAARKVAAPAETAGGSEAAARKEAELRKAAAAKAAAPEAEPAPAPAKRAVKKAARAVTPASDSLARQREWRGYVFRGYSPAERDAIAHYIKTGEKKAGYPENGAGPRKADDWLIEAGAGNVTRELASSQIRHIADTREKQLDRAERGLTMQTPSEMKAEVQQLRDLADSLESRRSSPAKRAVKKAAKTAAPEAAPEVAPAKKAARKVAAPAKKAATPKVAQQPSPLTTAERVALEDKLRRTKPAQRVALRELRALDVDPVNDGRRGFRREEFARERRTVDSLVKLGLVKKVGQDEQGRDLYRPVGNVVPRPGAILPPTTVQAPKPRVLRRALGVFRDAPGNIKDTRRFERIPEEDRDAVREEARGLHGADLPSGTGQYTASKAWARALENYEAKHPMPEVPKPGRAEKLTSNEKLARRLDALAEMRMQARVPHTGAGSLPERTPVSEILGDSRNARRAAAELEKGFSVRTVGDLLHLYPVKWVDDSNGVPRAFYPSTKDIRQSTIRRAVARAMELAHIEDPLPDHLKKSESNPDGLIPLRDALRQIHSPQTSAELTEARRRLKWDEAFIAQVRLAQQRAAAATAPATSRPRRANGLLAAFDRQLEKRGIRLTPGQRKVGEDIAKDLGQDHPMRRLVQGDVGSGKTFVAVRAALQNADNGGQTVIMAPTEALAQQHYRNVVQDLGELGPGLEGMKGAKNAVGVVLLTGSMSSEDRRKALDDIESGRAKIVIGTHAVLGEKVKYSDLGLVVVDEEHRFGVDQREALGRRLADNPPHYLSMTGTPIPRTVAMTAFGDMDRSEMKDMPGGRQKIASHVIPEDSPQQERMYEHIREQVKQGHQAYLVFPAIGKGQDEEKDLEELADWAEGEGGGKKRPPRALLEMAPGLKEGEFKGLRVGILHGKMPADEKERVLREFSERDPAQRKYDVLLSTTVVEVGVDVPNSTIMSIFDADRFGAAQLHQLRGRVGRGGLTGDTYFITAAEEDSSAHKRLRAIADTLDGFRVAEMDLENRRAGELFDRQQSGRSQRQRLLSLADDGELIARAHSEATSLLHSDPTLAKHPALAHAVDGLSPDPRMGSLESVLPETPAGERGRVLRRIASTTPRTVARRATELESSEFRRARFGEGGQPSAIDQEIESRLKGVNLERYRRLRELERNPRTHAVKTPEESRALENEHRLLEEAIRKNVSEPLEREQNSRSGRLENMDLTDSEVVTWLNAADLGARAQRARPPAESVERGIVARYKPQIQRAKGNQPLIDALVESRRLELEAHRADMERRAAIFEHRAKSIEAVQDELKEARDSGDTGKARLLEAQLAYLTSTPATRQLAREQEVGAQALRRQHVVRRARQGTLIARRQVAEGRAGFKITRRGQISPNDRVGDFERQQRAVAAFDAVVHNPDIEGDPELRKWVHATEDMLSGGPESKLPVRPVELYDEVSSTAQLHRDLAKARASMLPRLDDLITSTERELRAAEASGDKQKVARLTAQLEEMRASRPEFAKDARKLLQQADFFDDVRKALAESQETTHASDREARRVAREDALFKQHLDEAGPEKATKFLDSEQSKIDELRKLQDDGDPEEIAKNREVIAHAGTMPEHLFPTDSYEYKTVNGETRSIPVQKNIDDEEWRDDWAPAVLDDLILRRQAELDHKRDLFDERFSPEVGDTVQRSSGRVRTTGMVRHVNDDGTMSVQFGRNRKATRVNPEDLTIVRKSNIEDDSKELKRGLGDERLARSVAESLDADEKEKFRKAALKAAQLKREQERDESVPTRDQHVEFSHIRALGSDGGVRHGVVVGPGPKYGKRNLFWVRVTDRPGQGLEGQEKEDFQKVMAFGDLVRSRERVEGTRMTLGDIAASPQQIGVPRNRLEALVEKGALQRHLNPDGSVSGYFVPEDKEFRLVEMKADGSLVSSDVPHSATGVRMRQYRDTPPEAILHPDHEGQVVREAIGTELPPTVPAAGTERPAITQVAPSLIHKGDEIYVKEVEPGTWTHVTSATAGEVMTVTSMRTDLDSGKSTILGRLPDGRRAKIMVGGKSRIRRIGEGAPVKEPAPEFNPATVHAQLLTATSEDEARRAMRGLTKGQLLKLAEEVGYTPSTTDGPEDLRQGVIYRTLTRRMIQATRQVQVRPQKDVRAMTRPELEREIQRTMREAGSDDLDLRELREPELKDIVSSLRQGVSPSLRARHAQRAFETAMEGRRQRSPEHSANFEKIVKDSGFDVGALSTPAARRSFNSATSKYIFEENGKNDPESAISKLRSTASSLRQDMQTDEGVDRLLPARGRTKNLSLAERHQKIAADADALDRLAQGIEDSEASRAARPPVPDFLTPAPAAPAAPGRPRTPRSLIPAAGRTNVERLTRDNQLAFTPEEVQELQHRINSGEDLDKIADELETEAHTRMLAAAANPDLTREGGPNSREFDEEINAIRARQDMADLLRREKSSQSSRAGIEDVFGPRPADETPAEDLGQALFPPATPGDGAPNMGAGSLIPGPQSPFSHRDRAWFQRQSPAQQQALVDRVRVLVNTKHPDKDRNYTYPEAWRIAIREAKLAAKAQQKSNVHQQRLLRRRRHRGHGHPAAYLQNLQFLGFPDRGLRMPHLGGLGKGTGGGGSAAAKAAGNVARKPKPTIKRPLTPPLTRNGARQIPGERNRIGIGAPAPGSYIHSPVEHPGSGTGPLSSNLVPAGSKVVGGGTGAIPGAGAGVIGRADGTNPLEPRLEGLLDSFNYGDAASIAARLNSPDLSASDINALARRAGVSPALVGLRGADRRNALARALAGQYGGLAAPIELGDVRRIMPVGHPLRRVGSSEVPESVPLDEQIAAAKAQLAFARQRLAQLRAQGEPIESGNGIIDPVQAAEAQVAAARRRLFRLNNQLVPTTDQLENQRIPELISRGVPADEAQRAVGLAPEQTPILSPGALPVEATGHKLPLRVRRAAPGGSLLIGKASGDQGTPVPFAGPAGLTAVQPTSDHLEIRSPKMPTDKYGNNLRRGRGTAAGGGAGGRGRSDQITEQTRRARGGEQPRKVTVRAAQGSPGRGGSRGGGSGGGLISSPAIPGGGGGGVAIVSAEQLRDALAELAPADRVTYLENLVQMGRITESGLRALADNFGLSLKGRESVDQIIQLIASS